MGDDLIPNAGGTDYWEQPEERTEQETHDLGVIATGNPFLIQVDDWFTAKVTMSDHITNFDRYPDAPKEALYWAFKILHDELQDIQAEFSDVARALRENA
jgi:hypothetical protein